MQSVTRSARQLGRGSILGARRPRAHAPGHRASILHAAPETTLTHGLFDAHLHIIDPGFPLVPNAGYLPEPFTCADYLARVAHLGLAGGAIVSGSFQAFDQTYLLDALARLGPAFVGVTQLPADIDDEALVRLDAAGVRAVRFNLRRGGSAGLEHLESMAFRVHARVGWHVELYVDSRDLVELGPRLLRLPAVSIDHLGLSAQGLDDLCRLAERGVRVKATGFGRVDFDVVEAIRRLHRANPSALMFGTDLPSTRAPRPYCDSDMGQLIEALGETEAQGALWRNALDFYRPRARVPVSLAEQGAPQFASLPRDEAHPGTARDAMNILLWCDDLMTRTRVESAWKAAGATVLRKNSSEAPGIIVIDLTARDALAHIARLREARPDAEIIAFGPHFDREAFRAAKEAGASELCARGTIVERVTRRLRTP